jgi:hypothetical protein
LVEPAAFATAYQAYGRLEAKFVSCANANAPPIFVADPVTPELSVKSPFNLYHATKLAVLDAYAPAAHTHAFTLELPPGEVVPAGHATHALAPVTPEYVPAAQLEHTVVPNWPAGHDAACSRSRPDKFCEQSSAEIDPASEDDPAGHKAHAPPFGP